MSIHIEYRNVQNDAVVSEWTLLGSDVIFPYLFPILDDAKESLILYMKSQIEDVSIGGTGIYECTHSSLWQFRFVGTPDKIKSGESPWKINLGDLLQAKTY